MIIEWKMFLRENMKNIFRFTASTSVIVFFISWLLNIPPFMIWSAGGLYFSAAAYLTFRYDPFYFHSKRPHLWDSQSKALTRLSCLSYLLYSVIISGAIGFCLWYTVVFFYGSVSPAALNNLFFLTVLSGIFLSSVLIISVNNKCCRRANDD